MRPKRVAVYPADDDLVSLSTVHDLLDEQQHHYKELIQQQERNYRAFLQMLMDVSSSRTDSLVREMQDLRSCLQRTKVELAEVKKQGVQNSEQTKCLAEGLMMVRQTLDGLQRKMEEFGEGGRGADLMQRNGGGGLRLDGVGLGCRGAKKPEPKAMKLVADLTDIHFGELKVEYNQRGGLEWTSQRSSETSTEVKNLQPESLYRFQVAAVTSRGVGNWSEIKSITPKKALPPPSVMVKSISNDSMSLSLSLDSKIEVKLFMAVLSWQFDSHVKESRNYNVTSGILKASNLTAGTLYEVAVWAHTSTGDSPTTLSQQRTTGTPPKKPLLKAKALNQTAVECSWTVSGPLAKQYGVFYATSFLDLYRWPRRVDSASFNLTVTVDRDEQYLFLVRAVYPFLGPPSDYAVVKMIPDERLPPRNLHRVRVDQTQATLKWQPPYDTPSKPLTYVIHVRDVIQNVERDYKFTSQSNTVEYLLKDLEPGGRYSISVRLLNMSKEASFTLSTTPLPPPEALKILTENDHVFLFWKSLAVRERGFNESRGYEVHAFDSTTNHTSYLGNTTETFFRITSLLPGHSYTFSVQARCLLGGQLCGDPAVVLYNTLAGTSDASRTEVHSQDMAAVVVPVLFVLLLGMCGGLVALYLRHRRLQNNFTAFANSHYNSRLGSAIFSSGDELGDDDDEDAPMISGFSDDVPMVIA